MLKSMMYAQSCCHSVAYKNQLFFDVVVIVQEKNADPDLYIQLNLYFLWKPKKKRKNVIRLLCVIIGSFLDL